MNFNSIMIKSQSQDGCQSQTLALVETIAMFDPRVCFPSRIVSVKERNAANECQENPEKTPEIE